MNTQALDRPAVRRLRRGVVAATHVTALTVGADRLLAEFDGELNRLRSGRAEACFVDGEWGTGKTHFLALIRELGLKRRCAVAYLNLNGRSAALNHPQRFYHLIATRVCIPNCRPGLSDAIEVFARDRGSRSGLERWAAVSRHRSELARAVIHLLSEGATPREAPAYLWAVVLGTDLAWADYTYKREKALQRIADLGECLEAAGAGGLVLELDELETMDQLWNIQSRIGGYAVLGRLTEMPYVFPVSAITDRFHRMIEEDLKVRVILENARLPQDARRFLQGWAEGRFLRIRPMAFTRELGEKLVERIIALYRAAYGPGERAIDRSAVLHAWILSPVRSARTLIRRTVYELDLRRGLG